MSFNVIVLPGLDGNPNLLNGFVRRQPSWADTEVIRVPYIAAAEYTEIANSIASGLRRSPDVLVAESFSGPTAVLLARQLPQLKLLVLCNTFAKRPRRILGLAPINLLATVTPPVRLVAAMMSGGDLELAASVVEAMREVPRAVLAARLRLVTRCDVRAQLGALGCPVLVLHGKQDRLVPRECSTVIRASALRARYVELEAPHLAFQTRPDEAWAAISGCCGQRGMSDAQPMLFL